MAKASFAASDKEPAGSRCIFEVQSLHLSPNDLPPCQLYLKISAYEVAPVVLLNLSRSRIQASTPLRFDVVSLTICRARPCVFNAKIVYNKSFEDTWRDWTSKMQRLPAGSLSDAAKEALAIEAASISNHAAFEQHFKWRTPQNWTSLVATVDSYLQTMYANGAEPTPMEIGAVSMRTDRACLCCGKQGHVKADCRFKDAECRSCGKTGHLSNVCKGGNTKGGRKGKVKGKTKGKDNNKKVWLFCGKEGHVKSS